MLSSLVPCSHPVMRSKATTTNSFSFLLYKLIPLLQFDPELDISLKGMDSGKLGSFLILPLLLSCLARSSDCGMVPGVYVFGDSLVDVGNNNYLKFSFAKADFPHNGVDFPTHKPTGRFSNGKNAADFLAEKLGLPTSPPYLSLFSRSNCSKMFPSPLTGVSFASGGAGIFDGNDEKYRQSIPLSKQVKYFINVYEDLVKRMGQSGARNHLSKSLFTFVIGSNDLFDYFGSSEARKKNTPQQYVDLMVSSLKDQLKVLHDYSALKFVAMGVGPIGCCPSQRSKNNKGECHGEMNYWSHKYSQELVSMLQALRSELKDVNYSFIDSYTVIDEFIHIPTNYGFKEVKAACCGLGDLNAKVACLPISQYCPNRTDHLFWDLYHPTEEAARIFIDKVFHGSPQKYASPLNVQDLAAL
ncbi:hypothetical protein MLD38_000708 [Melastoma candidum]|uniref:Uncharacterized protein n=1 Tax=Melastoma candidum TaxID=119954 RepID=A0ACB9SBC0_9MYRT|nr:hypothetical protein MLD38_000708 [Melastoma candidum]